MRREAEVHLSQGKIVKLVSRKSGITDRPILTGDKNIVGQGHFPLRFGMTPGTNHPNFS